MRFSSTQRRHLPVLGSSASAVTTPATDGALGPVPTAPVDGSAPAVVEAGAAAPHRPRHPAWIKARLPSGQTFFEVRELVHRQKLHTVCESASCPNIGECWSRRALTIMILGEICTRSCKFCDVPIGRPLPPDPDEPRRVGETLAALGLRHTVITCVDRDDLADFGAAHWAETIRQVRAHCPEMTLEVLVGDFKGRTQDVDTVLAAAPDVFAHNLETVPRLSRQVRVQASYPRSYTVLAHAKSRGAVVKTGLMLGLGEEITEVREVLRELAGLGCDIVTLGQYLPPSRSHLPIARYVHPDEFAALRDEALALGISHVESGPLVRSSYHADGQAEIIAELRARAAGPRPVEARPGAGPQA
ncbi:MAG TPA: lipoyl synthase [Pseudomonadota bacterium]|nr:lipoyl synthase [Pseudomonadota bacterium]